MSAIDPAAFAAAAESDDPFALARLLRVNARTTAELRFETIEEWLDYCDRHARMQHAARWIMARPYEEFMTEHLYIAYGVLSEQLERKQRQIAEYVAPWFEAPDA